MLQYIVYIRWNVTYIDEFVSQSQGTVELQQDVSHWCKQQSSHWLERWTADCNGFIRHILCIFLRMTSPTCSCLTSCMVCMPPPPPPGTAYRLQNSPTDVSDSNMTQPCGLPRCLPSERLTKPFTMHADCLLSNTQPACNPRTVTFIHGTYGTSLQSIAT